MRSLQPLPRLWLVTDPRQGGALWAALAALPGGSGVLFREMERPLAERRALFDRVRAVARRHRLLLILAGDARTAIAWRADGWHGDARRPGAGRHIATASAHNRAELVRGRRAGAALLFVSPVHPTRTHPGARALGPARLGFLLGTLRGDVVAMGGMDAHRARALRPVGVGRWAAIDGLTPAASPDQKRKAVPR